ncbi:intein-containing Rv2578c family radical SAM protein [Actinoallomurus acaciae]|uniref:Intein-containing Rv2578c family radical SAM protein n=1 Tax=Actinoallomurus acaciae TaxID=502577 RepID=A0ABV5YX50_9ACTN
MRWDALSLDGQEPGLFGQPVTVDTPEFRGITFHEIRAKSIINKVPGASRVPFTWTINPYRGCSHACVYCLYGETPILMADGRTRPIRDVRAGDAIYGTEVRGGRRRYVVTEVLAHWKTVKPAHRVRLADGTELIAGGDHRFLTERGWRHVTGAGGRPHLTRDNALTGTGGFAAPPKQDADYRLGYLSGLLRADATGHEVLPAAGPKALRRARRLLADLGAATDVGRLIARPGIATDEWRKGFLAGVFDAGGGRAGGVLPISGPGTVRAITGDLEHFGFEHAVETAGRSPSAVRLRGGLAEHLRFFHLTDPAITRWRGIEGVALESGARLGVASVEAIGLDVPMYDITTGTGDFIANGVVSHNCFARGTHRYLDFDTGHDFDSQIVVKVNAPELVRRELAAPKWAGEHIAMGTNVDCYQRAEGRYRLMPGIIEALRDHANPFSILTKGSLILRDLPLLEEAAERTEVGAAVSVGFVDKELWRLIEPGTPSPLKRLEVCATLVEHGIGCGVLMGPILPYLSDTPRQLEAAVKRIAEAGASSVSAIVLHLRPGAREWFMRWLRDYRLELVAPYERLYGRGAYASKDYQRRISAKVARLAEEHGIGGRRNPRRLSAPPPPPAAPQPVAEQLPLL